MKPKCRCADCGELVERWVGDICIPCLAKRACAPVEWSLLTTVQLMADVMDERDALVAVEQAAEHIFQLDWPGAQEPAWFAELRATLTAVDATREALDERKVGRLAEERAARRALLRSRQAGMTYAAAQAAIEAAVDPERCPHGYLKSRYVCSDCYVAKQRPPRVRANQHLFAAFVDLFANSERPDKVTVSLDATSRTLEIRYEDLDDEWFNEIAAEVAEA